MRKLLLTGVAFAELIAAPAMGAEVAVPVAAPVWSWAGCYIGANVGYSWRSASYSLAPSTDPASQAFWNPAFIAGAAPSAFTYRTTGGLGGVQAGCNNQIGILVAGIEADLDWAHISGSQTINTNVPAFAPGLFTSSQTLNWLGTVRGRLGVTVVEQWLVYITGGVAYGHMNDNLNFVFPATNDLQTISTSSLMTGWTLGAGTEWAFGLNWTLRAEYLYVDLGRQTFTSVPGGRLANLATTLTEHFQNHYNILRVGLNYKFGNYYGSH